MTRVSEPFDELTPIDPAPPSRRRRRWFGIVGGLLLVAVLATVVIVLRTPSAPGAATPTACPRHRPEDGTIPYCFPIRDIRHDVVGPLRTHGFRCAYANSEYLCRTGQSADTARDSITMYQATGGIWSIGIAGLTALGDNGNAELNAAWNRLLDDTKLVLGLVWPGASSAQQEVNHWLSAGNVACRNGTTNTTSLGYHLTCGLGAIQQQSGGPIMFHQTWTLVITAPTTDAPLDLTTDNHGLTLLTIAPTTS